MKVKGKYNYDYLALCLQSVVVKRFRKYAKKIARSQSEALAAMIDFFEWHGYTPNQRFGKDIIAGQELNRKRIDASIAISKSIEKAQNIPLTSIETMLRSLFEGELENYEPKTLELDIPETDTDKTKKEKTSVSRIKYDRTNRKLEEVKERLLYVLEQIEPVNNRFGKDYQKIDLTSEEIARFKQNLKDS